MRSYETRDPEKGFVYKISVPDVVVFSCDINKISIETNHSQSPSPKIFVEGNESASITVSYGAFNRLTVNISSLLRHTFTDDDITQNDKIVNIVFKFGEVTQLVDFCVIRGYEMIGERIRQYGIYDDETGIKHQERHITRFVHFPFTLSFLAFDGEKAAYKFSWQTEYQPYSIDGNIEKTGLYTQNFLPISSHSTFPKFDLFKITNGSSTSKFTEEYNYTFWQLGKDETLIFLHHDDRKDGTFLRWIDHKGYWQQYLFTNGKIRTKYERGTEVCSEEQIVSDMIVEMHNPYSIKSTRSMTVCATSLNCEMFELVSTIANSLHVEMYLGKKGDVHQWVPVKVTTDQIERASKKILNDIEIELQIEERTITI